MHVIALSIPTLSHLCKQVSFRMELQNGVIMPILEEHQYPVVQPSPVQ